MRALILIAGALVLAGCSKNAQTANSQNVDESLTAENIVSNDVTAIDAVTGDAANIAAESDMNDLGNISSTGAMNSPTRPAPKRSAPSTSSSGTSTVTENSGTTTTTVPNAAGNAAD